MLIKKIYSGTIVLGTFFSPSDTLIEIKFWYSVLKFKLSFTSKILRHLISAINLMNGFCLSEFYGNFSDNSWKELKIEFLFCIFEDLKSFFLHSIVWEFIFIFLSFLLISIKWYFIMTSVYEWIIQKTVKIYYQIIGNSFWM